MGGQQPQRWPHSLPLRRKVPIVVKGLGVRILGRDLWPNDEK